MSRNNSIALDKIFKIVSIYRVRFCHSWKELNNVLSETGRTYFFGRMISRTSRVIKLQVIKLLW